MSDPLPPLPDDLRALLGAATPPEPPPGFEERLRVRVGASLAVPAAASAAGSVLVKKSTLLVGALLVFSAGVGGGALLAQRAPAPAPVALPTVQLAPPPGGTPPGTTFTPGLTPPPGVMPAGTMPTPRRSPTAGVMPPGVVPPAPMPTPGLSPTVGATQPAGTPPGGTPPETVPMPRRSPTAGVTPAGAMPTPRPSPTVVAQPAVTQAGTMPAPGAQPPGTTPRPGVTPPSPPAARDTELATERTLLEVARSALARGDVTATLAAVEQHARDFPRGRLVEEREVLFIQALAQAGRQPDAARRAADFRRRFPDSLELPAVDAIAPP